VLKTDWKPRYSTARSQNKQLKQGSYAVARRSRDVAIIRPTLCRRVTDVRSAR